MPGPLRGNYGPINFDEAKRYLYGMFQRGFPAVGTDFNDVMMSLGEWIHRLGASSIGEGSPNDGFLIAEASSTSNNFKVTGGDGTDEGAGRLFVSGYPLSLKSDLDYLSSSTLIHPRSYILAEEVLTDSSANFVVNELAGRYLVPDVATLANRYLIIANTATTITVIGGSTMVSDGGASGDCYLVELSTPGAPRIDVVYVDVFLDEVTEDEDPSLYYTHITPNSVSAYRSQLRQNIHVKEGVSEPSSPFTDADGRVHYYYKIATLNRTASANILSAMIVDGRRTFSPGGGSIIIEEEDGTPSQTDVKKIKVSNGTMTVNMDGSVSLETGSGFLGAVSGPINFTNDVSGVTPAYAGVIGTDIDTMDFPPSPTESETGQRFDFTVPQDYDSAPMEIWAVYRMSNSSGATIRLRTQAKIVDLVSGSIDTASYPLTDSDLVVPADDSLTASKVMEIAEGDFSRGDVLQVYVRRNGAADSNTDSWQVVKFFYVYTGQVATRAITSSAEVWDDYAAETATTPGTIGTDIDTENFSPTVDNAQKVVFSVPQSWDNSVDAYVYLTYAMSTQEAGKKVRLQVGGEAANPGAASVTSIPETEVVAWPSNITAEFPQPKQFLGNIPASLLARGGHIEIYIRRKGSDAVGDTHDGWLQGVSAFAIFGVSASAGAGSNTVQIHSPGIGEWLPAASNNVNIDSEGLFDLTDDVLYKRVIGNDDTQQGGFAAGFIVPPGVTGISSVAVEYKSSALTTLLDLSVVDTNKIYYNDFQWNPSSIAKESHSFSPLPGAYAQGESAYVIFKCGVDTGGIVSLSKITVTWM